jgi:hypothetical protein
MTNFLKASIVRSTAADVFILVVRTALEQEVLGSDLGDCVAIVRFNESGLAAPGLADDSDLVT